MKKQTEEPCIAAQPSVAAPALAYDVEQFFNTMPEPVVNYERQDAGGNHVELEHPAQLVDPRRNRRFQNPRRRCQGGVQRFPDFHPILDGECVPP